MLRLASLEQLLNTGQTLGNIVSTCNTAGMEGTHGKLSTRFTDGLSGDSTNCFANIHVSAGSQVATIALAAYAVFCFTGQHAANLNLSAQLANAVGNIFGNIIVDVVENLAILIQNIFSQVTTNDAVIQGFDNSLFLFAFNDSFNLDASNIVVANTDLLHSTIGQNSIDGCFGHSGASSCQHLTCCVNNIGSNLFIQEVVYHCFLQHLVSKGITNIDAYFFHILAIHIVRGIQADFFNLSIIELSEEIGSNIGISFSNQVAFCIQHTASQGAAHNAVANLVLAGAQNSLAQTVALLNKVHANYVAIVLAHDYILRNVYKTTSQITGVSSTQCGIGQAFAGTMGGNEVFQNGQAFTEVRFNRTVDNTARGVGHQATHTGQLTNLLLVTTGTGISHHSHGVELIHGGLHQNIGNLIGSFFPQGANLLMTFLIAHQATTEHTLCLINLFFGCIQDILLSSRNLNIGGSNGNAGLAGIIIAHFLNNIQNLGSTQVAKQLVSLRNQLAQFLLINQLAQMPFFVAVSILFLVEITHFQGQLAIENGITNGGGYEGYTLVAGLVKNFAIGNINLNQGLQCYCMVEVSQLSFIHAAKAFAFTQSAFLYDSQIICTQNHILGRYSNGLAVLRRQDVVYGHHQHTCFSLRLYRKRQMDSHLVTVEVGVISGTYQWMQLNCATFGQDGLKGLNTQSVQSRCTIEEYGMLFNYILKDIPNFGFSTFNLTLCALNIGSNAAGNQALHYKGLEQLQSHFLGQAALMHFQLGAYYDYGTTGVVNTLT